MIDYLEERGIPCSVSASKPYSTTVTFILVLREVFWKIRGMSLMKRCGA